MVVNKYKPFGYTILVFVLISCTASINYMQYTDKVENHLVQGNYAKALMKIDKAKKDKIYSHKDRLLYYLDKGITLHYAGNYSESNNYLNKAEKTMEELYTRSFSQIAFSYLANDNIVDYWGETYEHIYVNVFKSLNYSHLGDLEGALVEIRKVNIKLQELDDKFGESLHNVIEEQKVEVDENLPFYSDALAHYLSAIFYYAEDEPDQGQISVNKLKQAWATQKHIYDYPAPEEFIEDPLKEDNNLNIVAFSGTAPKKRSFGGMITTYEDYLGISDLTVPVALPNIPFPGAEPGYHFKFAFPVMEVPESAVSEIRVLLNGKDAGSLYLLEKMGSVAEHTFEAHKMIIYIKTIIRTVTKGLAAAEAKKKLKKEAEADDILGAFIDFAIDAGVDATERADLRCWSTMPQNCFVGQFTIPAGTYDVEIQFLDEFSGIVDKQNLSNLEINSNFQLLEFVSLK